MSQLFHVFFKMEAVQHMAGIRKTLAQADNPGCTVAVDIDVLHCVDVVALVQAGFYLIVEGLPIHAIPGDVQRTDQLMPLGVADIDALGNGGDGHHDALAVVQMHVILVGKYVQHLRCLRKPLDICHYFLQPVDFVAYRLPTDRGLGKVDFPLAASEPIGLPKTASSPSISRRSSSI